MKIEGIEIDRILINPINYKDMIKLGFKTVIYAPAWITKSCYMLGEATICTGNNNNIPDFRKAKVMIGQLGNAESWMESIYIDFFDRHNSPRMKTMQDVISYCKSKNIEMKSTIYHYKNGLKVEY